MKKQYTKKKDYKDTVIIDLKLELTKYNLAGRWNDYVGVQKEILRILRNSGFFDNNIVENKETKMKVVISPKDVRETFGSGNRFQRLPRRLKEYKVVTIGKMKELIKGAKMIEDNVSNIHREETDTFAYFRNIAIIDGEEVIVRISVKKKTGSNHFHIHHIDTKQKSLELLGPSNKTDILETQDSIIKIAYEENVVNANRVL